MTIAEGPVGAADRTRGSRSPLALGITLVLALLLFSSFVGLGTWQVHRRAWKLDLIAKVNARVSAPPAPAPGPAAWPAVSYDRDVYRHVTVRGTFLNDRETLVQAVTEQGPGYWLMTPLRTDAGFTLLVNRGFVPQDPGAPHSRPAGETRVTGLLRLTEPKGGFLRSNDPAADRWFSRDVAAIARARRLGPVAPYFVDADATPNPGGLPVGGLTVISFPNNHLVYMVTWYGLALLVAIATVILLREERRLRAMTRA